MLLLDEPLSALDLKLRKAMQIELKHLQRETGITFIFVTHDQDEALTMSDRIAVMSSGELQQLGDAREIYERPRNMFVADFIGDTNLLEVWVDKVETGRALCHLGGGHLLTCDAVDGVGVGARVHMSLRPERLYLSAQTRCRGKPEGSRQRNHLCRHRTIHRCGSGRRATIHACASSNSTRGNARVFEPGTDVFVNMEQGAGRLLVD